MLDILYFPIWWYTLGLKKRARGFVNNINTLSRYLALKILLTNLFKPMFGQYNWKGRLISLMMRSIQLVFSLLLFLVGVIFILAWLILWIILPPLSLGEVVGLIHLF